MERQYNDTNINFMKEAIRLSGFSTKEKSLVGGPFGAIVVKDNNIVASGLNNVIVGNDPTAHGEIVAIRMAGHNLKTFDLTGCDLYTSCEPCPMCLMACHWAGIKNIYYAATRKDAAKYGWKDAELYKLLKRNTFGIHIKECRSEATKEMRKWVKEFPEAKY